MEGRSGMTSNCPTPAPAAGRRVLVVEDELIIRMLIEDMLSDLGYTIAGAAGRVDEAVAIARSGDFDVALLDVNLSGEPVDPVAEILAERKIPFVFATGYGDRALPDAFRDRPRVHKPFQQQSLRRALAAACEHAPA
jgi:CheY-like chemotaxis protein